MAITHETAVKAAEETARRQAFDNFLAELNVEQRHYTRENRMLMHNRKSLVLQERMYFRNIPAFRLDRARDRCRRRRRCRPSGAGYDRLRQGCGQHRRRPPPQTARLIAVD